VCVKRANKWLERGWLVIDPTAIAVLNISHEDTTDIYQLALLRTFPFQLPRMLISTDQATAPLGDISSWVEAPNTIALWCQLYE